MVTLFTPCCTSASSRGMTSPRLSTGVGGVCGGFSSHFSRASSTACLNPHPLLVAPNRKRSTRMESWSVSFMLICALLGLGIGLSQYNSPILSWSWIASKFLFAPDFESCYSLASQLWTNLRTPVGYSPIKSSRRNQSTTSPISCV